MKNRAINKLLPFALAAAMLFTMLPGATIHAADSGELPLGASGIITAFDELAGCTHEHDAECGYIEAVPCGHQHDESCGEDGADCAHSCDETCGYTEAAPCGHVCDETCGGVSLEESGGIITAFAALDNTINSTVLEKKSVGFNYNDHTVTWQITVNQNKMSMTDVVVTDTILQYQSFVASLTVKVGSSAAMTYNATSAEDPAPGRYKLTDNGDGTTTLKINLGDLNEQADIEFKTVVDVDNNTDFKTETTVTVGNSVSLSNNYGNNIASASNTQTIDNKALVKSGTYDAAEDVIKYTVNINPHGMDLTSVELEDQLEEGLKLKPESVKLYEARVKTDVSGNAVKDAKGNLELVKGDLVDFGDFFYNDDTNRKSVV